MAVRSSVRAEMSARIARVQDDMEAALHRLAWPAEPGEKIKVTHDKIYAALKGQLTHRQIRALWAKEWRNIPAHVYLMVLERVEAHEQQLEAKFKRERERQARLWSLIHHSSDPEFYRGAAAVDGDEND